MFEVSSYLISKESNIIKILLEIVDGVSNIKSNYYYEVVINGNDFKIISMNPVNDLLRFLYDTNINLNSRKMDANFTYKLFEIISNDFIDKKDIKITIDDNVRVRANYYNRKIISGKYSLKNDHNIEVYNKNREILKEILESKRNRL